MTPRLGRYYGDPPRKVLAVEYNDWMNDNDITYLDRYGRVRVCLERNFPVCATATAKRRRKQAKLRNGRKVNPMERRDRLAALRRKK